MNYITEFEKKGFGLFVHFGLYSILGKGEWAKNVYGIPDEEYEPLTQKFKVKKNWAKDLVKTAKKAGCKYITLTTRHHDGFSLYDTCGLNSYDAPHVLGGRDLIREFVDACNDGGILPMFYHTLLDWRCPEYKNDFKAYIDYLIKSIEILCTEYGKIGGFWFDGAWDKPDGDWQEDRLYGTIRKYQPEAMIINNTGLSALGKVGHPEIDSVTFERGKPSFVDNSDRHRAGEMCQVLNDHWGYAKDDYNYKPVREIIENLVECRYYDCNFLLNVGPTADGSIRNIDKCYLEFIGQWIKQNKNFIYTAHSSKITSNDAYVLEGENGKYYAVIKDVNMTADINVQRDGNARTVTLNTDRKIKSVKWLDNGQKGVFKGNTFEVACFNYGTSHALRVAEIVLK
ncbi:MAG: alpha-L-fucosidase [Clostridiales bacterium]|nr:alpha-L-fucosidase [Clostridiales bacterium]